MKTKGLRHPSFALTIIHWSCILCSIRSNLPSGEPDSFRPRLCSESHSHMAYFNMPPLLPTAVVPEPSPKSSADGSLNLLSNQSGELADLASLGWAWGAACLVASTAFGQGTTATHNLLFQKPLSRSLKRAKEKCRNRSRDQGKRLGDSILNRFNLKKEDGYLTLCKNLTPHSPPRETGNSQLCCHTHCTHTRSVKYHWLCDRKMSSSPPPGWRL